MMQMPRMPMPMSMPVYAPPVVAPVKPPVVAPAKEFTVYIGRIPADVGDELMQNILAVRQHDDMKSRTSRAPLGVRKG